MEIPYGFDCYAFQRDEIKYFEPNIYKARRAVLPGAAGPATAPAATTSGRADFIKFTRKNEEYPAEQINALARANRLNMSEIDKRLFCGIKIQIGIGVVTNFLRKGMQYKPPIRGRSELINGSWTGVMRGLTLPSEAPASYDMALGNFLAWDEEFPYIKFGPFFAVESKLVFLTGSSRRIETSSFGTNMSREVWLSILTLLLVLSLLASLRIRQAHRVAMGRPEANASPASSALATFQSLFFIYTTMLLNKPSVEFDDLVWPKKHHGHLVRRRRRRRAGCRARARAPPLSTSMRALSYMWSAACLVLASIYSGEMLAVMLLHADQNIDTIAQLIESRPQIEPVIRQDDMTHNLMLKSLDANMLRLHNITRVIPRAEVYTRPFIESVSRRQVALLGDDELIDTIYDLYHKYYPLYKSKITYLQYPISIMYRRDLSASLERPLRRGMVQMFEMGLVHRWYQAQKDTYIRFYDTYERDKTAQRWAAGASGGNAEQKYKPLSMHHFGSFFLAMLYCKLFALLVLVLEMAHQRLAGGCEPRRLAGTAA